MKRSLVVDTSVRVLYHSILVLSLYFLFAGHNQPGGGFIGGLTAGAAVSFRYVAGGVDSVRSAFRTRPWTILGFGLLLAAVTAAVPLATGRSLLEHGYVEYDAPGLQLVKTTSALPFDIGVYLVVLGLILMMFEAFGDDPESGGLVHDAAGNPIADADADSVPVASVTSDAVEADALPADLEHLPELESDRPPRAGTTSEGDAR